jgi:hypothetical protein
MDAMKLPVEGMGALCYTGERLDDDHGGKMEKEPKIEFLYWEDCPSHPGAWQRLQEVMTELGVEAPVEKIQVLTDEDAERLRFPGSPTIRVDGVDVDAAGAATAAALTGMALTCRLYRLKDGRPSPLPSKEMLRKALG